MQNLQVTIPDNKLPFFLELLNSLGFAKVKQQEVSSIILSKEQLMLVEKERTEIKNNPDYLLDWEDAQKSLNAE